MLAIAVNENIHKIIILTTTATILFAI